MTDKTKNKKWKMIEILELAVKYFKTTFNCVLKKTEENEQNG